MAITEENKIKLENLRRRQIQTAALGLFYRNGYTNTTVADIAKESGISKGLVYRYFDSKADILLSFKESLDVCFNELEQMDSPKEAIRAAVQRFLTETDEKMIDHPLRVLIFIYIRAEFNDERLRDIIPTDMGKGFYGKMFKKGIELGEFKEGDPDEYGESLWHNLLGYTIDFMMRKQEPNTEEVHRYVDRLCSYYEK